MLKCSDTWAECSNVVIMVGECYMKWHYSIPNVAFLCIQGSCLLPWLCYTERLTFICFSVTPEFLQHCLNPGHYLQANERDQKSCLHAWPVASLIYATVCWCNPASPKDAKQSMQPVRPIDSCYCAGLVKLSSSDFADSFTVGTDDSEQNRTLQDCAVHSAAGWLLSSLPLLIV